MTMSNYRIRVEYWVGTQQHTGYATTYRGATRIAGRNRNAYDATYWDADGNQLFDDGHGLRQTESTEYAV